MSGVFCPLINQVVTDGTKEFLTKHKIILKSQGAHYQTCPSWSKSDNFWKAKLFKVINEMWCEHNSINKPTYWPTDVYKRLDLQEFFITRKVSTNFVHVGENLRLILVTQLSNLINLNRIVHQKRNQPNLDEQNDYLSSFTRTAIKLNVALSTEEQLDEELENFI